MLTGLLLTAADLAAQAANSGLDSPVAIDRANAEAALSKPELLAHCRGVLAASTEQRNAPRVVRALVLLGENKDNADVALIARFVGDLDSGVSSAATTALRAFGRDGLSALQKLSHDQIDALSRRKAIELLVHDHIRNCCIRDMAVNPLRLPFKARFTELDSLQIDLTDTMFKLVRQASGDIREDISSTRYYYYGMPSESSGFLQWGGLVIAALAERHPAQLMQEMGDLAQLEAEQQNWWWGYRQFSPVTLELATFFARQGKPALVDRLISDMESGNRGRGGGAELFIHVPIVALQTVALGDFKVALERLETVLRTAAAADDAMLSQAHYLRARILMQMNEQGEALYALEESMESSSSPMLLALVDDTFAALSSDRRFQAVIAYCRLSSRAAQAHARPYTGDVGTEE